MINFENLEVVLFDFDDTLCIHKSQSEELYNSSIIAGDECWENCEPSIHMKKFMLLCKNKGTIIGLISATNSFKHMIRKNDWVKEKYDITLENYCVGKAEDKLNMLIAIANDCNIKRDRILIVDDM